MNVFIPSLDQFVRKDHPYRQILEAIDFKELTRILEKKYSNLGRGGYAVATGFKCLLLQYMEDLSDREVERFLEENNAGKYFCGFNLDSKTPDHSYFGKLRQRIGVKNLSKLFQKINESIIKAGFVGNVFHFVDSSALKSKINVWSARDKAIADKENDQRDDDGNPKLNNQNMNKYSSDPEARFGCKGKNKFWIGYKRHQRVDMRHGIVTQVAVTSAEVLDAKAFIDESLCPDEGMVFLDKGYDYGFVDEYLEEEQCSNATIRKKNHKEKNRDLDRWRSGVRMPFENVFSKMNRQTKYRGKKKVLFQAIFEALVHNFKRLITIQSSSLALTV